MLQISSVFGQFGNFVSVFVILPPTVFLPIHDFLVFQIIVAIAKIIKYIAVYKKTVGGFVKCLYKNVNQIYILKRI